MVDLYKCRISPGNINILHCAAKNGLAELAKEVLLQGYYNMLLESDETAKNRWPLYYAVTEKKWATVKIFLETLSYR